MFFTVETASLPFHRQVVNYLELGAGSVFELHLAFVIDDHGAVVWLIEEGVQEFVLDENCDFIDYHGVLIPFLGERFVEEELERLVERSVHQKYWTYIHSNINKKVYLSVEV